MTQREDGHITLGIDEIEQVARVAGPMILAPLIESMKTQNGVQTTEFRAMLTHHEAEVVKKIAVVDAKIEAHTADDLVNFGVLQKTVHKISEDIDRRKWLSGKMIAALIVVSPFLVEFFKHLMKW